MREFSDFEKQILEIMVDLQTKDELCRENILKSYFDNKVRFENESIELSFYHDSSLKKEYISIILLECGFLYSYLKSNYYIHDIHKNLVTANSEALNNSREDKFKVPNYEEYWIASYNVKYRIILSQTIVSLVRNKFKTPEQIRFEKQLEDTNTKHNETMSSAVDQIQEAKTQTKWSIGAFIVSLIALIAAIVIPLITSIKLHKDSIKEIERIIQENKVDIPNDTLNINSLKALEHNDQEK